MTLLLDGTMHGYALYPRNRREPEDFDVTICRFDPKKGLESGQRFILPVDCIDEEHAVSSTLSNAVAFTGKSQGSEVLSVASCCVGVQEHK